jgi:hypothetical protein
MLQQRSKAFTFGLALKFTIDGKPFVPPDPANDLLRGVEQEIAGNLAQIRSQEVEAARYSGGLVLAMSLSTLATMRQTQAMLDQKRLALKYGLPQYIGFRSQADSVAPATNITPRTEVPASANEKDWGIVGVDTRVTESNTVWSKYAWKLTLRNDSDRPQVFQGTIEFQDSDGFIVDTSSANDLVVPAKSAQVFTGFALIRAEVAEKVARTSAKIGKIR